MGGVFGRMIAHVYIFILMNQEVLGAINVHRLISTI